MNVISEQNEILNAAVSIKEIEGVSGLVMESRGGAKGKSNERNIDYSLALDTILNRLQETGVGSIQIFIVSSNALKIWTWNERKIEIDGSKDIGLKGADIAKLHGKISKAQQEKKEKISSKGGNSTKRILIVAPLDRGSWNDIVIGKGEKSLPLTEAEVEAKASKFSPHNAEEAKEKTSRIISLRRGQPNFRKQLLKAYENQCAVTSTEIPAILEAAHIVPYTGASTNHITNGLLLRADIHTLFDLGLIGINKNYEVVVSAQLGHTEYESYNGVTIKLPKKKNEQPSLAALNSRPLPSRH